MRNGLRTRSLAVAAASVLLIAGAVVLPHAALAQSGGERIQRYDVNIGIERDGTILVRETIDYDFGATPRHGILRDIPVRLRYDDTRDRIYPIEDLTVRASEGTPADYQVEDLSGGLKRIRIGDPDREITGRHTY